MRTNVYECMFLLDTTKVQGDTQAAEKNLRTLLEKHSAEVLVSRPWDERRLSYQIGNQKKGLFFLTYFRSEGKNLTAIEQDCALNEMIMRQLILRIDPKLEDTMLAVAKGEHAVALHNYQEDAAVDGVNGSPSEDRPRRRRDEGR